MQTSPEQVTVDEAVSVARSYVYSFLAAALADPLRPHFEQALGRQLQMFAVAAAGLLASEAPEMELGPGAAEAVGDAFEQPVFLAGEGPSAL